MKPKGRPKKYRIVRQGPGIVKFSPRGKPGRPDEIELKTEEFEAIRLADLSGLKQIEAAKSMGVSQQTFSRVIRQARRKLAEAFVRGKTIKIRGGVCLINSRQ